MSTTTVSVIVTAHNAAPTIDRCLDTITNSTHADLEIVVVDDGSEDDTATIVDEWSRRDHRIRWEPSIHRGRRASLERAHKLATGEALCWVDADDLIEPRAVQRCIDKLDDAHQLVYTHRLLMDPDGTVTGPDPRNRIPYSARQLLVDNMIFHLRVFTRDLFERSGGVGDLESAIDWDMNLRMTELTTPRCVPQALYKYRISPNRMTGRADQQRNAAVAVRRAIARRDLPYELTINQHGWHLKKSRQANRKR